MQSSSPSTSHCSQVSIKVQHKIAKKKPIRRKRVDLDSGCTYYLHINSNNHGFTHRGTHHCMSSRESRFYLGDKQSPHIQDKRTQPAAISNEQRQHFHSDNIQPQHHEGIGHSHMFSQLPNFDDITATDWSFHKSI
uniref:Transcriptional activator protein n=1 Tax=Tomato yellow leaf curl virus TaxID=10832 RepID=A0A0A1ENL2_9GEMI|nr:AC2 protein [Tomato yellow leaf curl virus]